MFRILLMLALFGDASPANEVSGPGIAVYKSSALGFSLEYPSAWTSGPMPVCGNTYMGLKGKELFRAPIFPVRFTIPDCSSSVHVTLRRDYQGTLQDRLKRYGLVQTYAGIPYDYDGGFLTLTNFEFGSGLHGKKMLTTHRWISKAEPDAGTFLNYIVLAEGRLIELGGMVRSSELRDLENQLDLMAKSIRIFPPLPRTKGPRGTFVSFEGFGFSFDYPAHWIAGRPYDDSEQVRVGLDSYLSIYPPEAERGSSSYNPVSISSIEYPYDPDARSTPDEWRIATIKKLGYHATDIQYAVYETENGQFGMKLWYLAMQGERKLVSFVLPKPSGKLQILTYSCPAHSYQKLKPVIERGGMSFRVSPD